MLKLKLQYFAHLIWRADSLEKTLMLGKTEGKRQVWKLVFIFKGQVEVVCLLVEKITNICCYSITKSCPTLCDPMDCSMSGFPVIQHLPEFSQTHVQWVSDVINHLIFCYPLLLLHSILPSIRVFSNESALRIRRQKYWSFSFSISPSNKYLGSIASGIDWSLCCSRT